jgi:hypothetical protein
MKSLSKLANRPSVEDIIIFIADSLRFDHLSNQLRNEGISAETIAPSTATASSIPSLMSGTYPATHKVWGFGDALPQTPPLVSGTNRGLTTQHIWESSEPEQRPPLRSLRLQEKTGLEDVESPFTVVIHDRGAHGPYDYLNGEMDSSDEFFELYSGDKEKLRELYQSGAEDVQERCLELLNETDIDDTLVIFTSDHGEMLGETEVGGLWGHGSPMCEKLVKVPTVFIGAGLPEGEQLDSMISGTDLAPTILAARGDKPPQHIDGVDLWNSAPPTDRMLRSDFWASGGKLSYMSSFVTDDTGSGAVFHLNDRFERLAFGIHRQLIIGAQAPANRTLSPPSIKEFLKVYTKTQITYGNPNVEKLRGFVPDVFEKGDVTYDVGGPSEEQLRALGYVE